MGQAKSDTSASGDPYRDDQRPKLSRNHVRLAKIGSWFNWPDSAAFKFYGTRETRTMGDAYATSFADLKERAAMDFKPKLKGTAFLGSARRVLAKTLCSLVGGEVWESIGEILEDGDEILSEVMSGYAKEFFECESLLEKQMTECQQILKSFEHDAIEAIARSLKAVFPDVQLQLPTYSTAHIDKWKDHFAGQVRKLRNKRRGLLDLLTGETAKENAFIGWRNFLMGDKELLSVKDDIPSKAMAKYAKEHFRYWKTDEAAMLTMQKFWYLRFMSYVTRPSSGTCRTPWRKEFSDLIDLTLRDFEGTTIHLHQQAPAREFLYKADGSVSKRQEGLESKFDSLFS